MFSALKIPAKKVDSHGRYQEFRGVTVISAIQESDLQRWRQVYDFLNTQEEFKKYFALLPPESYHMTAFELYTENDINQTWVSFIDDNMALLEKLHLSLSNRNIQPKASLKQIALTGVLVLDLSLDKGQEQSIISVVNEYSLENKLPRYGFHLTLAYKYKDGINDNLANEIRQQLLKKLSELNLIKLINFDLARICYFNSMTKFIPLSESKNPWKSNAYQANDDWKKWP